MTPEKLAANRANGAQSQGPATPEGRERTRESPVRHGFYARPPDEALRVLGENPEEFKRLLDSLEATWQPSDELQSRLVGRLARAVWRLERSDRVQESLAVKRVKEANRELERGIVKACQAYADRVANLEELARSLDAGEEYVTCVEDIDLGAVYGDKPGGKAEEILILVTRLAEPPASGASGEQPGNPQAEPARPAGPTEPARPGGSGIEDDEDDSASSPLPDVPVAIGPERAAVREQLAALLAEGIAAAKAAYDREREGLRKANVPDLRDSAIAPRARQAELVSRMEDSSFRQVARLTELLLKLKKNQPGAQESKERKKKK